jgi:hypothetical protein
MYSVLRLLLILRLFRGDGWAWCFRIILCAAAFSALIYSVVRS